MHISKLISARIDEENKASTREKCVHVTDLSKCLTGVYWRLKGAGEALSDRQYRIFKAGHLFEEFVVNSIPDEKIVQLQGKLTWPDLNMVGSFDMMTREDDGSLHLWELKSQNSQAFHWNRKRADGGAPNPIHVEQVMLYASKLKELGQFPEHISIVYVSKDDLCLQQFDVQYDEGIVASALHKASYLNACLRSDTPPMCIEPIVYDKAKGKNVKNWMATYCDRHDLCAGFRKLDEFNRTIEACIANDVDYEPIWEEKAEAMIKAMK